MSPEPSSGSPELTPERMEFEIEMDNETGVGKWMGEESPSPAMQQSASKRKRARKKLRQKLAKTQGQGTPEIKPYSGLQDAKEGKEEEPEGLDIAVPSSAKIESSATESDTKSVTESIMKGMGPPSNPQMMEQIVEDPIVTIPRVSGDELSSLSPEGPLCASGNVPGDVVNASIDMAVARVPEVPGPTSLEQESEETASESKLATSSHSSIAAANCQGEEGTRPDCKSDSAIAESSSTRSQSSRLARDPENRMRSSSRGRTRDPVDSGEYPNGTPKVAARERAYRHVRRYLFHSLPEYRRLSPSFFRFSFCSFSSFSMLLIFFSLPLFLSYLSFFLSLLFVSFIFYFLLIC